MPDRLRFVFWNIQQKESNIKHLIDFASANDVDIIMMCECPNLEGKTFENFAIAQHIDRSNGIEVLYRNLEAYYTRERSRFCILKIGTPYNYNIAVAHLNSNLHSNGENYREADIEQMKKDLLTEEYKSDNKKSCILGDLNTDVFDSWMCRWTGFNARLFRFQMGNGSIKRHENEQDLFYNPMLKLYRDSFSNDVACGTYYYASDDFGWHCYDHILMKQPLVEKFVIESLTLVGLLDGKSLVKESTPVKSFSDHLPFYFEFMK